MHFNALETFNIYFIYRPGSPFILNTSMTDLFSVGIKLFKNQPFSGFFKIIIKKRFDF